MNVHVLCYRKDKESQLYIEVWSNKNAVDERKEELKSIGYFVYVEKIEVLRQKTGDIITPICINGLNYFSYSNKKGVN